MGIKLRSRWPFLFSTTLVLLFVSYYFYAQFSSTSDRVIFIMVYGILSIASVIFLALYIIRKNTYRYRLGSTQSWLQAHIYIGIISLVLVLMHSGFNLTGTFNIFLFVLFVLVIISGIVGSLIYNITPLSLMKFGREIMPEDEIINNMEKYLKEADRLVLNTSGEFREMYQKTIRPFFQSKRTKWEYLFMEERELISKRRNMVERYKGMVSKQDIYDLNILCAVLIEKERLSFMWTKTKMQRAWLNFHTPLTSAMLAAAVIHILSIIYY